MKQISRDNEPEGTNAVQAWYNEGRFYNYEDKTCENKDGVRKQCGHYKQVGLCESFIWSCESWRVKGCIQVQDHMVLDHQDLMVRDHQ